MKRYDLLVIGGDAAGMSAASQARRANPSLSICVVNRGAFVSYAACGIPYYIAGAVSEHTRLLAVDIDEFVKKRNIQIEIGAEATGVDCTSKTVTVSKGRSTEEIGYGRLVIATGARPLVPPIPGIDSKNVYLLRTLEQGIALMERLKTSPPQSALIMGGGFIGLEMAEAFGRLGIGVKIVEKMPSVAMPLSPGIRDLITAELMRNDVTLATGVDITAVSEAGSGISLATSAGEMRADLLLCSVGIKPETGFLAGSGIALNERGAIIVNERSETNVPDVYAAGDCATVRHLVTGKDVYLPLGTTANKQGRVAGLQAAGVTSERFPGVVGSQMVKVFDLEVAKTGFNDVDAQLQGMPSVSKQSSWRSRAGYYPGAADLHVNLTINTATRALIGGEVAGTDGAALRINTVAAAVSVGMKIEDFAYLDLGYAPPFAPVWDPIINAAQGFIRR